MIDSIDEFTTEQARSKGKPAVAVSYSSDGDIANVDEILDYEEDAALYVRVSRLIIQVILRF